MAGVKKQERRGIESYLRRVVEVRTAGGGSYRGELEAVDATLLYVARTNGRGVLIPRSAVAAVLDEQRFAAVPVGSGEGR
jgi:hypothetical protein